MELDRKAVDTKALQSELEQYRMEKEKIRDLVGQIGGAVGNTKDKALNVVFIVAIFALMMVDVLRHFLHVPIPLPPILSLEFGILLVSVKIIWMIYKQTKVEHFQFWILNSIEFRLNEVSKKLRAIEKTLEEGGGSHDA